MDAKSHARIMMGYSYESIDYRLFDPIKHHINLRISVMFEENNSSNTLSNSSYGIFNSDPLEIL